MDKAHLIQRLVVICVVREFTLVGLSVLTHASQEWFEWDKSHLPFNFQELCKGLFYSAFSLSSNFLRYSQALAKSVVAY